MALDVAALRGSFDLILAREPELSRRFYETLFERHPEARPLFGGSVRAQEEMLTRTLVAVVDRAEDGVWLADTLRALGAKHVDYRVTDEMYPWVGDALLATLAEVAREAWTPRVDAAWRAAYDTMAALMIEGARGESAVRDALEETATEPSPDARATAAPESVPSTEPSPGAPAR